MKKYILLITVMFFANITFGQSVEQAIVDVNALLQKNIKEIDRGEIKFNKKTKNFEVALSDGHNGNYVNIFSINKIKSIVASSSRRKAPVFIYTFGEDVTMKGKKTKSRKINRCRMFFKTREDAAIAKDKLDYIVKSIKTEEKKKFEEEYKKIAGDFTPLFGTYNGHPFFMGKGINKKNKVKAELTSDFHLTISEDYDGLWVKQFDEKVIPQEMKLGRKHTLTYILEPTNAQSEFSKIEFSQMDASFQSMAGFGSITLSTTNKKGESLYFIVNGLSSISQNSVFIDNNNEFTKTSKPLIYSGTTEPNTFGKFRIAWHPAKGRGFLAFENVKNEFTIIKSGDVYQLIELSKNPRFELKFKYDKGMITKQEIINGGGFLKYVDVVKKKQFVDEKEFLIAVGESFYQMFRDKYRPPGNYTFTLSNSFNGTGIYFFKTEKTAAAYIGEFKNSKFHGKGKFFFYDGAEEGTFTDGMRDGMFFKAKKDGSTEKGKFVNNIREGIWKIKTKDGDTYDLTFQNGKKVNTVATNRGAENTQIKKHYDKIVFQLSGGYADSYKRMADLAENCAKKSRENKNFDLRNSKSCLRHLKDRVDGFIAGVIAAQTEMTKAIKSAEKSGCTKTIDALKKADDELERARVKFVNAHKAFSDMAHASSVSNLNSQLKKGSQLSVDGVNSVARFINMLNVPACYERTNNSSSSLSSSKSKPKKSSSNSKTYTNKRSSKSSTITSSSKSSSKPNTNTPSADNVIASAYESQISKTEKLFRAAQDDIFFKKKAPVIAKRKLVTVKTDLRKYKKATNSVHQKLNALLNSTNNSECKKSIKNAIAENKELQVGIDRALSEIENLRLANTDKKLKNMYYAANDHFSYSKFKHHLFKEKMKELDKNSCK